MSQLTQRKPYGNNWGIPLTTPTLIPGMQIAILTGTGWVKLHYSIVIALSSTGLHPVHVAPYLDGAIIPGADSLASDWGAASLNISRTIALKPGAGQHIFELYAWSSYAGDIILIDQANMIVDEPGY